MCRRQQHKIIMQAVLGESKRVRTDFSRFLARDARDARRSRLATSAARPRTNRINKKSAFGRFRAEHWAAGIRPGTPEAAGEQRRIAALWAGASPRRRRRYEAIAGNQNGQLQGVANHTLPNALGVAGSVGGAYSQRNVRRRAAYTSLEQMRNHPVWKSDAMVSTYGCPLNPAKEDRLSTDAKVAEAIKQIFRVQA